MIVQKNLNRMIRYTATAVMVIGIFMSQRALSQTSSTRQLVTLQVMELNKLDLEGGPLTLQIGSVNDGAVEPNPETDANTKLCWTSNGDTRKIAVGSNIASPKFILKIEAEKSGNGSGIAEPEVTPVSYTHLTLPTN